MRNQYSHILAISLYGGYYYNTWTRAVITKQLDFLICINPRSPIRPGALSKMPSSIYRIVVFDAIALVLVLFFVRLRTV